MQDNPELYQAVKDADSRTPMNPTQDPHGDDELWLQFQAAFFHGNPKYKVLQLIQAHKLQWQLEAEKKFLSQLHDAGCITDIDYEHWTAQLTQEIESKLKENK